MMVQESWLKLMVNWILPNTSSCWRTIWYRTWMKVKFFSMIELHTTDHMQHDRIWLIKLWSYLKIGPLIALTSSKSGPNLREEFARGIHTILKSYRSSVTEWYLISVKMVKDLKQLFKLKEATWKIKNVL